MTKLVVADEVAAHIEPRRAMAVLMNVGKPLQTSDNIVTTERVAIFRESGLRDDVTVANLQDACLKLVVLARARAHELQVDQQVERAKQTLSAKAARPTTKPKPKGATETDKPVCRFFLKPDHHPDGCKNGDTCQYSHPNQREVSTSGSDSHNLQACTHVTPWCMSVLPMLGSSLIVDFEGLLLQEHNALFIWLDVERTFFSSC